MKFVYVEVQYVRLTEVPLDVEFSDFCQASVSLRWMTIARLNEPVGHDLQNSGVILKLNWYSSFAVSVSFTNCQFSNSQ